MNQTLIKDINIWTMDERDSRFFGWVLLENGKIASMGEGEPPAMPVQIDGDVVYGEGGVLTPGLIDIHSHIGLYEDGLGFEGADGNEDTDPATPHLRALDGVNPFDRSFREALEAGVTAAAVSPGSANPIGGQIALLKTAGRRVDDMILKAPLAIKFALGENPKSVYHDKDETPVTRMATAGIIREELYKAKEYFLRKARAEDDPEQDEPDFDIKMEALQPLLWGKAEAHFHAHRADDIFTAIRIAKEFHVDLRIDHTTDGALIADDLAKEGFPVAVGPSFGHATKYELRHKGFHTPAALAKAGCQVSIITDSPVIEERYLALCAGRAVFNGLSEFDALKAITINAAKHIGIEDRVGSIEAGKDADFVLTGENPFAVDTHILYTIIDGNVVYEGGEA